MLKRLLPNYRSPSSRGLVNPILLTYFISRLLTTSCCTYCITKYHWARVSKKISSNNILMGKWLKDNLCEALYDLCETLCNKCFVTQSFTKIKQSFTKLISYSNYFAVSGLIIVATSAMLLAGNPPFFACSCTNSTLSAL